MPITRTAGKAPRLGNRVVYFGDSIVGNGAAVTGTSLSQGKNWTNHASLLSGGRMLGARNSGVSGNTTTQMLARMATDVIAFAPAACIVMGGTNDAVGGGSMATARTNLRAVIDGLVSNKIMPILCTIPPSDTSNRHTATNEINSFVAAYGARYGFPVFDAYSVLVDPTNGNYQSTYFNDGIHPNDAGIKALATAFNTNITPMLPYGNAPLAVALDDKFQLEPNPVFLAGLKGGAGTEPNNWNVPQGTAVGSTFSLVTSAGIYGNALRVNKVDTDITKYTIAEQVSTSITSGFVAGDVLAFCGKITTTNMEANVSKFTITCYVTTSGATYVYTASPATPWDVTAGVWYMEITVPAAPIAVIPSFQIGVGGAATINIGQITVLNLTSLGLV